MAVTLQVFDRCVFDPAGLQGSDVMHHPPPSLLPPQPKLSLNKSVLTAALSGQQHLERNGFVREVEKILRLRLEFKKVTTDTDAVTCHKDVKDGG